MIGRPPPRLTLLLTLIAAVAGLLSGCGDDEPATGSAASAASATPATVAQTAPASSSSTTTTSSASAATRAAARPDPHAFAAAEIAGARRSRLARTGRVRIPVAVGGPGRISAFGQAELEGKGILRVAHAQPLRATRAGTVTLTLRLTRTARDWLASGKNILMYVAISFSRGQTMQRLTVPLKGG